MAALDSQLQLVWTIPSRIKYDQSLKSDVDQWIRFSAPDYNTTSPLDSTGIQIRSHELSNNSRRIKRINVHWEREVSTLHRDIVAQIPCVIILATRGYYYSRRVHVFYRYDKEKLYVEKMRRSRKKLVDRSPNSGLTDAANCYGDSRATDPSL